MQKFNDRTVPFIPILEANVASLTRLRQFYLDQINNKDLPPGIKLSASNVVSLFEMELSCIVDELRLQISKLKQIEKTVADLKDVVSPQILLT